MQEQKKEAVAVLSDFIEKPINIIMAVIALTVFIISTVKYLYLSLYAIKCQDFYKIPVKYFEQINTVNVVGDWLPLIMIFVVLIFLTLISLLTEKKSDNTYKIIFFLVNIILGLIVIFIIYQSSMNIALEMISRRTNIEFISSYVSIIPFVFLIIAIIFGFGLTLISFSKKSFPKLALVQAILILITVVVIFISALYSLPIAPEDKSQYEVAFISDENIVILSEVDGKFLTVSYARDNESEGVIFYTQSYKLIPMEGLELSMSRFNQGIKIDSDSIVEN